MVEKHKLQLRYFEVLTMLALLEYKEKKCQYAVLECGIGGHLDSTNIVD
jgi:dihydrofolate synthase/folylpolyglutamate synthase